MPIITPEEILLLRCVQEETKYYLNEPKNEQEKEFQEKAKQWIFEEGYGYPISLRMICNRLNKNINKFRATVLFCKQNGLDIKGFQKYNATGLLPTTNKRKRKYERKKHINGDVKHLHDIPRLGTGEDEKEDKI